MADSAQIPPFEDHPQITATYSYSNWLRVILTRHRTFESALARLARLCLRHVLAGDFVDRSVTAVLAGRSWASIDYMALSLQIHFGYHSQFDNSLSV